MRQSPGILSIVFTAFLITACMSGGRIQTEIYSRQETVPIEIPEEYSEVFAGITNECALSIDYSIELPVGHEWENAREAIIEAVAGDAPGHDTEAIDRNIEMWKESYTDDMKETIPLVAEEEEITDNQLNYNIMAKGQFIDSYNRFQIYRLYNYDFLGGAHGTEYNTYIIFDSKTGDTVNLDGFIPAESLSRFRRILADKNPACAEAGHLPLRNFYVSDKGLTIVWQPYEISSEWNNTIECTVSWDEINEIL